MKTALIALATFAAIMVPLGAAWAFGFGHHDGFGKVERMMDRLDLNDEQRTQVFSIIDAARPNLRNLRHDMHEGHKALRDYVKNGNTDDAVLEELAAKQGDLVTAMTLEGGSMMRDIRNVLTEEQRAQVEKMMDRRKGKHRRHGDHGGFGGHGGHGKMGGSQDRLGFLDDDAFSPVN